MRTLLLLLCCAAAASAAGALPSMGAVRARTALPAARIPVELAVRAQASGFPTVIAREQGVSLTFINADRAPYRIWGELAGRRISWTASRRVRFENDERVDSRVLSGDGIEAELEPVSRHRAEYRLRGTVDGKPLSVSFLPETGSEAAEFLVRAEGFGLRTRTSGVRSVLRGDYDSERFDAPRLAAVGVALALIRLDPPSRRRR